MASVIIGLGVTGLACAQYFKTLNIPFTMMDSRIAPPKLAEFKSLFPDVPLYTGGFSKDILSTATQVILSPGISKHHPDFAIIPSTASVIGDIELFAESVSSPVVAITGSNGKSTVTTLVGEMAKAVGISVGVGGNLGVPVLKLLLEKHDLYVLELSSFQLETTYSLKPVVATVLNICPDHMDRYSTLVDYIAAKSRIFKGCQQIVVNRADPILPSDFQKQIPIISFGLDAPTDVNQYGVIQKNGIDWLAKGKKALLPTTKLALFGRHNMANALAALALGESIHLPMEAMLSTLEKFQGLPHRCEWVKEINGVQWINDSKGTNVGATLSALQGLAADIPGKWILIAGGVGKNADFTPLRAMVKSHCRAVVLIGEAADELQALLEPVSPCYRANSLEEAVEISAKQAKPGDGVLLSPACASLDMFRDFEHRGEVFKAAVMAV